MKRSGPPQRRTPLKRTPTRSRPRRRPPVNREAALAWRALAVSRFCAMCPPELWGKRVVYGHHIVHEQVLRAYAQANGFDFERERYATANLLTLCGTCHSAYHFHTQPVPRRILKAHAPGVFAFADRLGLAWFIDKHYPEDR